MMNLKKITALALVLLLLCPLATAFAGISTAGSAADSSPIFDFTPFEKSEYIIEQMNDSSIEINFSDDPLQDLPYN